MRNRALGSSNYARGGLSAFAAERVESIRN